MLSLVLAADGIHDDLIVAITTLVAAMCAAMVKVIRDQKWMKRAQGRTEIHQLKTEYHQDEIEAMLRKDLELVRKDRDHWRRIAERLQMHLQARGEILPPLEPFTPFPPPDLDDWVMP